MMNRKTRNILCTVLVVLMCVAIGFTMFYAKSSIGAGSPSQSMNGGSPPQMQGGSSDTNEPPAKPDGDTTNGGQMPNMSSGSTDANGQIPSMPNGNSDNGGQMPNMSSGSTDTNGQMPSMPNGGQTPPNGGNPNSLSFIHYFLFFVEGLILSLTVIYMIMSGFNKKSLKQTLLPVKKAIAVALCAIVLAIGITFGANFVTSNILLGGQPSMSQSAPSMGQGQPNTDNSNSGSSDNSAFDSSSSDDATYTSATIV